MSEYGAETKVGDFEVTVSCEKEVFGFKVTVGDTFSVDEFLTEHSFNLVADVGALLGRKTYHASNHLGKVKLGKIFGHTNVRR